MLIQIIQFLMSLSLIIIIHEFGHFIFARLFGCRVEKFYLFFDYKFSLFSRKIGDTTYGIGWIPLGGYVKISGMVDESMDTDQLKSEPKPWEFRSKPAWQRFFIIVGGVMMNFLLAMTIYIGMAWSYGENYIASHDVYSGYSFSESAQALGFQNGDKILSIDGKLVENSGMLSHEIIFGDKRVVLLERNGMEVEITLQDSDIAGLLKEKGAFISLRHPFVVAELSTTQNLDVLQQGDSLVSFNGVDMSYADQFFVALEQSAGDSVRLGIVRGGEYVEEVVSVNSDGKIGVGLKYVNLYPVTHIDYSFWESIPKGFAMCGDQLAGYFRQLGLIFSPETEAYKSVGGFITMGSIFPQSWNWMAFWNIVALLSIMIGVLNIMPIPALDGGHLLFIIYEMITGRAPSQKFMEVAQTVGFFIIISVVLLANGSDIIKLFM